MKRFVSYFLLSAFLVACTEQAPVSQQDKLIQSVLWYQHAGEQLALYYQGYNLATRILTEKIALDGNQPLAVVLDIDETVLDNSPQSGQQIIDNRGFSDELWDEWCLLAEARPLPGALEFTQYAQDNGVAVFYITNRKSHLLGVTIENLAKLGFPGADSLHILPRIEGSSSSKDERRAAVAGNYDIVLLLGDNLGDFDGMFDDRSLNEGHGAVEEARDLFGSRFIVFPNPIYGSWERPALTGPDGEKADAKSRIRAFRESQNE